MSHEWTVSVFVLGGKEPWPNSKVNQNTGEILEEDIIDKLQTVLDNIGYDCEPADILNRYNSAQINHCHINLSARSSYLDYANETKEVHDNIVSKIREIIPDAHVSTEFYPLENPVFEYETV